MIKSQICLHGGVNHAPKEWKDAELIALHSLEENWRKGLGTIMLDFILSDMKEKGFDKVMLWTLKDSYISRNFYEKYGFKSTRTLKQYHELIEICYEKGIN